MPQFTHLAICLLLLTAATACSHDKPVPTPVPVPSPNTKNTLAWDRIADPLVTEYRAYACYMPDCDPEIASAMVGIIPQTPIGVTPTFKMELAGSVGAVAVTALYGQGRESKFSKAVTFDRR